MDQACHILDHMNLEASGVPEVLRPLYESSTMLAQKITMAALHQLRQISQDISQASITNWGRRPPALRALSHQLSRRFNEALNGFSYEGWVYIGNDGVDDVTILVNSNPEKMVGSNGCASICYVVLCAKESMLLQNVPHALLLRFLREHRSEWVDNSIDVYAATSVKIGPCAYLGQPRVSNFGGHAIFPLAQTIEHEELLEVIKLEGVDYSPDVAMMPRDVFLLQLCSGTDENAVGTCSELIFAPIDPSFVDNAPLLPSGFRIIPLDCGKELSSPNRTMDLASVIETGAAGNKPPKDLDLCSGSSRSVVSIAFEFAFESHMQDNVASMARQYLRSIISSVQRVSLALSPSHLGSHAGLQSPLGTPEAHTLALWITRSYRFISARCCRLSM